MKVAFRRFTSSFQSWESMLTEVAEFASGVGRENLINISCSGYLASASYTTLPPTIVITGLMSLI
jgi:hypothetical protein